MRGYSILVAATGSIGLDTTRTPSGKVERALGGAGSYFSYCASFFTPVALVSAVGGDFPDSYWDVLARKGVDLRGVQRLPAGRTLAYDSTFDADFHHRRSNGIDLGVMGEFHPRAPNEVRRADFVYLGTMEPEKQLAFLEQFPNRKLAFMDTIDYYIENRPDELWRVIKRVNGIVINDVELHQLTGTANLVRAAYNLMDHGPSFVLVKKGEHGSVLFSRAHGILPFPAYPLAQVVDPTGAGDSFAGGFLGHLAAKGGRLTERTVKEALVYANVMGSYACEDFSLNRLVNLTRAQIEERFDHYKRMLLF